jgi:hypothetical protein
MFKTLDIFKLTVAVSYSVCVALLLSYDVEIDPSIQNWAIVLTHLTAIPLVVLIWNTQWIAWTILTGVLLSVFFHISLVFEWYIERTEPMDICFANLTLMLITRMDTANTFYGKCDQHNLLGHYVGIHHVVRP